MSIQLPILFFLSLVVLPSSAASTPPPDILVIYTDDHRADALGCAGNPHLRTPNIDRLADRGTMFQSAYLSGADSAALCMPSRAMLMTGRNFPRIAREGGWNLAPQPTLPSVLREHGYRTHMTGKWHNGGPALSRAFPDAGPVLLGGMGDHLRKSVVAVKNGAISDPVRIAKHSTEAFTDGALDFISTLAPDDPPFFLYLEFSAPHDPRQPVSPWRECQEAAPPPLPPNFLPRHPFNNGALFIRDEHLAPWPRPEGMIREQTGHFYAMIEQLDDGLALGSHGLMGKQSAYEHSLRVPMIIAGPGLAAGRKHEGIAAIRDLMPTLLDLAGTAIPEAVDGRSLKPALTGNGKAVRERLSLSLNFGELAIHALREGPWKLIRYPYLDRTQLFNLMEDPHEMRDLSANEEHAPGIAAMMKSLAVEIHDAGVEMPLTTDRRIPAEVDWSKVTQQIDTYQPDWIRQRFSSPAKR